MGGSVGCALAPAGLVADGGGHWGGYCGWWCMLLVHFEELDYYLKQFKIMPVMSP